MGKSTIYMAIFNSKLFVYQRVTSISELFKPYGSKHYLRGYKKNVQIKVNYTPVPLPFRRYDWITLDPEGKLWDTKMAIFVGTF